MVCTAPHTSSLGLTSARTGSFTGTRGPLLPQIQTSFFKPLLRIQQPHVRQRFYALGCIYPKAWIKSTLSRHAFPGTPPGPSRDDFSGSPGSACSNRWQGASSSVNRSITADKRLDVASSIVEREIKPAVNAKREPTDPVTIYTYNFEDDATKDESNPAANVKREDAGPIYTYHFTDDAAKDEANPAVNAKREDADPDAIYIFAADDETV